MYRHKGLLLLIFLMTVVMGVQIYHYYTEIHTEDESERYHAVMLYSDTNMDENQNICRQIAEAIEKNLSESHTAEISSYEVENEKYISIDYKISSAILMDADAVVIGGSDAATVEAYQKLKEREIPFILVDGDLPESGRNAYVGIDNFESGRIGADFVVTLEENCFIAVISPLTEEPPQSLENRYQGFMEEIQKYENAEVLKYLDCSLDYQTAYQRIKDFLFQNPKLNILYCTDSISGTAAMNAVLDSSMDHRVHILCYDQTKQTAYGLANGWIDGIIIQDTESIGKACADILEELAAGEKVTDKVVYVNSTMLTPEG